MKKIILSFCILIFIIQFLMTEENDILNLSINDAVNLALAKNLGIKIEKLNFNEKKWALITVWNTFLPDIKLSASLSKINQEILDYEFEKIKEDYEDKDINLTSSEVYDTDEWDNIRKGDVTANFNITFDLNAKMIFDVSQTVLEYNSGKISLEIAKKEIERDIKKSYYNLIILKENINFLEKSLESAKKRYELTEKQFENKTISELDKLNSEYNYKEITTEYIDKINNYDNALLSFNKLLGLKSEAKIKLTENIEISNEEKFFKNKNLVEYLENNLDIKLLKANINQKINDRNIAIAELTPTFSIGYLIDPKFSRTDPFGEDNNWFYYKDDWEQDKGALTFSISLQLSSFIPFSKEQMKIVNANYNIQRYKLLLEDIRKEKQLEFKSIISEINKNKNNINSMEVNLEMAKKIFKLSELSFQNGLIDILKLIDSEKNLIEANLKLLNAKNSYLINIIDLEYLLNTKI